MKNIGLVIGLGLLATTGFSQQVSNERKASLLPVENKETIPAEILPDSAATLHSMARNGKTVTVPITKETESNSGKPAEKATIVSSARKPD